MHISMKMTAVCGAFTDQIKTKFANAYRMAAKVAKANKDGKEEQWLQAAVECESDSFGEKSEDAKSEVEAEDSTQPLE